MLLSTQVIKVGERVDQIRELAKESEKIKRARAKLQKKIEEMDRQITQEALKKKVQEIHHWISRHSSTRIVLKDKAISLFDENKNTARYSQRLASILDNLKKEGFQKLDLDDAFRTNLRKKIDNR